MSKLLQDKSDSERFWEAVDKTGECWLWTRSGDGGGYGWFTPSKAPFIKAHKFAYEEVNGPVPKGLHLDHICHTRSCVRPSHLQAVTQQENNENTPIRKDNTSGFKGVSYHKATGKWMAYGQYLRKNNYLGIYDTREEAAEVALQFRMKNHTNNLGDQS